MAKYLNPKSDLVFKRIFGQKKHLLISFLNAILPVSENLVVTDLEYLSAEQVPEVQGFKNTVVDVKCKANNDTYFIVEMQVNWTDAFMQRVLYNASKAYTDQLSIGEPFKSLLPVFAISIIDYVFDKETPNFYHHYKIVNIDSTREVIKGLEFIFIELPKFSPASYSQRKMQVLWLRFLKEAGTVENLSEDLTSEKDIAEAAKIAEIGAYTPAQLEYYNSYFDAVSRERTLVEENYENGKKEGWEEGKVDGIEEGKTIGLEMALEKLIKTGMAESEAKRILGLDRGAKRQILIYA